MTEDFTGRAAIVTGSGAGLGRGYALELARRGAAVVVNDYAADAADAVVAEIVANGDRAVASHASVATRVGGAAIVQAALDAFGRIDILIANAGVLRTARFEEMDDADIDMVLDVHLKGSFHVGQPAFAAMKRQGYGRILFTASSSGLFGHPWQAAYAAAKAGIAGLTNVVALEGCDHGILANAILPSARTAMTETIDWAWTREASDVASVLGQLRDLRTEGDDRLDPAWVVPLALYLVSERSSATHGLYSACGGRYARVFVGAAPGWLAPTQPTVEEIAAHWDTISDPAGFDEPHSVYDEALTVRRRRAALDRS